MKRRNFLKMTGLGAVGVPFMLNNLQYNSLLKPLFKVGKSSEDRVLIIIRMNGGSDGLNMVIPIDQYDNLMIQRQNILIPQNDILDLNTSNLGLHSSMSAMSNMFLDGNLGIVQNVGYPVQNRSHFKSTDIWSRGIVDQTSADTTGWLGRYLQDDYPTFPEGYPSLEQPDPFAISLGSSVTSTCQGLITNFSMAVNDLENLNQLATSPVSFEDTKYGDQLDYMTTIIQQSNEYSVRLEEAMSAGNTLSQSYDEENDLAKELRNIAQLISGGLKTKIYVLNVKGFDTHEAQADAINVNEGRHQILLKKISDAVGAFQEDLNLLGIEEKVLGFTFSEFGRQIASNASYGTDHGDASSMLLFGSCIDNNVIGSNPVIADQIEPQKGLDYQIDFRDVYASILKDWFKVEETKIASIFEHEITYLPIVQGCNSNVELNEEEQFKAVSIFPNPSADQVTVQFSTEAEATALKIVDVQGNTVVNLFSKFLNASNHSVDLDVSNLSSGLYFIIITKASGNLKQKLIKK